MAALIRLLRAYPTYSDVDGSLEKAISSNAKALERYDRAHGSHFTEFARRHPNDVAEVLFRLERELAGVRDCYKAANESLGTARRELSALSKMHETITRSRRDTSDAVRRWEKSVATEESTRRKVDNLRMGGDPTALAKAQAQLEAAEHQSAFDARAKEAKTAAQETADREYEEAVFTLILSSLKKLAASRAESAQTHAGIGPGVAAIAREVPPLSDDTLGKLQNEIQSIEQELDQLERDKLANAGV